jgi:hypothetical protein
VSEERFARGVVPGGRGEPPLSPCRAFVVQFRIGANGSHGHFAGRVEHIVSGHAARFYAPAELLAFFRRILADPATRDDGQ